MRTLARSVSVGIAAVGISGLASVATAAPVAAGNSQISAYPVHSFHKVGKTWSVRVNSIDKSADSACKKADPPFYHKPKKGYTYVVVQFTGKKLTGGKKQNLGDGIITNMIAKGGKQYGQIYSGAVAPHDAATSKAVGKGGKTSGGFVYMVKNSDIKAGHLEVIVETLTSSTPYFYKT